MTSSNVPHSDTTMSHPIYEPSGTPTTSNLRHETWSSSNRFQTRSPEHHHGMHHRSSPYHHGGIRWHPPYYRMNGWYHPPSTNHLSHPGVGTSASSYSPESLRIPDAFIPPRHAYSNSTPPMVTPNRSGDSGSTPPVYEAHHSEGNHQESPSSSGVIWEVQPNDCLCGRGAPVNYHQGNQFFRDLVKDYQTVYLCSKRSDKPRIAIEILEIVQSRGGRFLRRVKTSHNGRSRYAWEEIGPKRAYEKVCQALREGAPEIRRQMMASSKKISHREKENSANSIKRSNSHSGSGAYHYEQQHHGDHHRGGGRR